MTRGGHIAIGAVTLVGASIVLPAIGPASDDDGGELRLILMGLAVLYVCAVLVIFVADAGWRSARPAGQRRKPPS